MYWKRVAPNRRQSSQKARAEKRRDLAKCRPRDHQHEHIAVVDAAGQGLCLHDRRVESRCGVRLWIEHRDCESVRGEAVGEHHALALFHD